MSTTCTAFSISKSTHAVRTLWPRRVLTCHGDLLRRGIERWETLPTLQGKALEADEWWLGSWVTTNSVTHPYRPTHSVTFFEQRTWGIFVDTYDDGDASRIVLKSNYRTHLTAVTSIQAVWIIFAISFAPGTVLKFQNFKSSYYSDIIIGVRTSSACVSCIYIIIISASSSS